jgi:hypothetical protein
MWRPKIAPITGMIVPMTGTNPSFLLGDSFLFRFFFGGADAAFPLELERWG